ncbi:hypothetical protein LRY65_03670 [Candidatus Woesebacteria bacterium]|nr:hypothetical protein [Candidatus Woesebacteria bacterium]MCD8546648.1 hypothetical protein [Candidatus Woesebacteria bacterium]
MANGNEKDAKNENSEGISQERILDVFPKIQELARRKWDYVYASTVDRKPEPVNYTGDDEKNISFEVSVIENGFRLSFANREIEVVAGLPMNIDFNDSRILITQVIEGGVETHSFSAQIR